MQNNSCSSHRHSSHHNRHRWEKSVGDWLLLAAQITLVLCMGILPFLWGGRHTLAVGVTGLCFLAVFLLWATGSIFRGLISFQPAKGTLIFLAFLCVGLLQSSPWFSGMVMEPGLAQYWQMVLDTAVVGKEPVLAVLFDTHREFLLIWGSAAMFYMLAVQLFSGSRTTLVLLAMAVALACGICGLASLIQHFGRHDWLFWVYKGSEGSVSGPYFNKNHFAQLQAMGLFTALGLALSVWEARRGSSLYDMMGKRRHKVHVIVWGLVVVICGTALVLSLSRAGILCAVAGLAAFLLHMLCFHYGKKIALPIILLLLAGLLVSFYGLERVIFRLEMALSGEDFSGLTRWEMWRTMLDVIALSPWWGTGVGSVRSLAPLFDLSFIPGFVTFDAHNDYLELAIAFGIPLTVLLLLLLTASLVNARRRLMAREARRSSLHPLAVGILLGILVAAGHEFFDYGLKQSANLMMFLTLVVILGGLLRVMGGASNEKGSWQLGRPLYIVPLLLLVPVLWLGSKYTDRVLAGTELVRLQILRDVPEVRKAFDPETLMTSILRQSRKVLAYVPEHLEALDAQGMAHSRLAWIYQTEGLCEQVSAILDRPVSKEQIWRPQYSPYLEKAFHALLEETRLRVAQEYGLAAKAYARMANANPMSGLVYSALALSRDSETAWKAEWGTALLFHETAHRLYPTHISVLQKSLDGYWRAWQEERDSIQREGLAVRMLDMAHDLGRQSPSDMKRVYPMLWQIRPDVSLAQKMTSDTIQGQEALANYFANISLWPEALSALNRMEELNRQRLEEETPETMGNQDFLRRERREKALVERIVLERKIGILDSMGDIEQAATLRTRVAALRYAEHTPLIQRADGLMARGEYLLAEEILKKISGDRRAYIRHAEILFSAGRYEQLARVLAKIMKLENTDSESSGRLDILIEKCTERGIAIPDVDPQHP